jgi:hypothetical protein
MKLLQLVLLATLILLGQNPAHALQAKKLRFSTMSLGQMDLYIDEKGRMKMVTMGGNHVVAENHHYFGYNDDNKMYIEYNTPEDFAQYLKSRGTFHSHNSLLYTGWKHTGDTIMKGVHAQVFERTAKETTHESMGMTNQLAQKQRVVVTTALKLPYDWIVPYSRCLSISLPIPSQPLEFTDFFGARPRPRMTFEKISTVTVPDDFFTVPKNYKRGRDEFEVFVGGTGIDKLLYKDTTLDGH